MTTRIRIVFVLAACLLLGALGFFAWRGWLPLAGGGASRAPRVAAGALRIAAETEPAVPRVGANELRIRLEDAQGTPVDAAQVELRWQMPAMGAMPAMGGRAQAEPHAPGDYRAALDLAMHGTWRLELRARPAAGEPVRVTGSLTTGMRGVVLEGAAPEPGARTVARPGEPADGEVQIDTERRQRVGIRTARVERGPLAFDVRAVGRVTTDETALVDVSLKLRGWITKLEVDALGVHVRRGQVLFQFYAPELLATQQELLQALRSQAAAQGGTAPGRGDALVRAARRRLALWDVAPADVEALVRRGEPLDALPIRAPASGYVIEKNVVEGAAVEPGARLYRIAPLSRVWIDAAVQEADLALVAVGQPARVGLHARPGEHFEASVAYVYPTLDVATRTGRIRIELENPGEKLLPDMYADVELRVERGERLLVPVSAVIYAGPRRVVFVDRGEGRLAPRTIEIGAGNGEVYEVLSGLEAGEMVVSSGTFLVAAESRLASALSQW
jgi:Cu(I)/Ag(I) efflux system membrane fusion protein